MARISTQTIGWMAGVESARDWQDRVYITIRGNGGSFAGERNSKVWIDRNGKLTVEAGKGTVSSEYSANLKAFRESYAFFTAG